jgi:tripartite-type tricarboxylate transporter receptor subunit TctC
MTAMSVSGSVVLRVLAVVIFYLGVLCSGSVAGAQSSSAYPSKPVQMVVPFSAGGPNDIFGRAVARKMSEVLGQPFVVVNRDGAGGVIGTEMVARAQADGYTVLFNGAGPLTIEPAFRTKGSYDPLRDFAPIGLFARIPFVLLVHPGLPAQNVNELVSLARSRPGKLNYASAGFGGATFLAIELFKSMTRTEITHVPYKGAAPSVAALLASQVDLAFVGPPTAVPMVRAGRLRALATTGVERLDALPDVPTMAQAGVNGYEFTQWYGLLAPARVARPILSRLHDALSSATADPDVRSRVTEQGGTINPSSPEEFAAYMRSELVKAAETVRAAGIKRE